MHPGIWEKIGEALLWLQMCWILAGFALMIYLALKVFPKFRDTPAAENQRGTDMDISASWSAGYDGVNQPQSVVAGNYRLEAFPQKRRDKAKVIEFRPEISASNRRFS